jgi:hypothetical protein
MSTFLKYFLNSSLFTVIAIITCFYLGGTSAVIIGITLSILEISLSFDNAVVNASVLSSMDEVWRKRFLTWGILIAVFGARLIIPILIVSITAGMNPIAVFNAAFFDTATYAHLIENIHVYVSGFGSAFLGMVFLKFFFDESKENHWIPFIEKYMQKLGTIESVQSLVMLAVTAGFSAFLIGEAKSEYLMSSICGVIIYLIIDGITAFIEPKGDNEEEDRENEALPSVTHKDARAFVTTPASLKPLIRGGIVSFLYLEILDTSFSLDGVIGAFAITQDIVIILLGLTIGSFFVRSLTIFMVDKKALQQLAYLEHGAFWSVGILALFMLLKTKFHISELIIVGVTISVLIISVAHSYMVHRKVPIDTHGTNL